MLDPVKKCVGKVLQCFVLSCRLNFTPVSQIILPQVLRMALCVSLTYRWLLKTMPLRGHLIRNHPWFVFSFPFFNLWFWDWRTCLSLWNVTRLILFLVRPLTFPVVIYSNFCLKFGYFICFQFSCSTSNFEEAGVVRGNKTDAQFSWKAQQQHCSSEQLHIPK